MPSVEGATELGSSIVKGPSGELMSGSWQSVRDTDASIGEDTVSSATSEDVRVTWPTSGGGESSKSSTRCTLDLSGEGGLVAGRQPVGNRVPEKGAGIALRGRMCTPQPRTNEGGRRAGCMGA